MSHSEPLVIKPTFVSVDQELLRRLHVVCESALENASDCLAAHESSLGRTTRKNIRLAGFYEQDIRDAKQALAEVRSALGWPVKAKSDEETRSEQPPAEHWLDEFESFMKTQMKSALHAVATTQSDNWRFYRDATSTLSNKFYELRRKAGVNANAESFAAFEAWIAKEFEANNRSIALNYNGADLERDEEILHTISTIKRYKQLTHNRPA